MNGQICYPGGDCNDSPQRYRLPGVMPLGGWRSGYQTALCHVCAVPLLLGSPLDANEKSTGICRVLDQHITHSLSHPPPFRRLAAYSGSPLHLREVAADAEEEGAV